MKNVWISAAALTLAACMTLPASAAGNAAQGKMNFLICQGCHKPDGGGDKNLGAPMNGGQMESYLVRQLKNFRAGIRGGDPKDMHGMQMRPMAMALPNDAAVENVAAYIATLKPAKPPKTIEGDVTQGKELYKTCLGCHGLKGEGVELFNSPKLAGQHDWYIVRSLEKFKSKVRGGHEKDEYGKAMCTITEALLDEKAMKDVAAYIATF